MTDKQKLILIVDDNNNNLQLLGNLLKLYKYNIMLANNGEKALKALEKKKPDLILLDIMMPEMSGFEVCEKIKSNEDTADIPVIFLTAKSEINDVVKGFKIGGSDYITKPFEKEELVARIKTQLQIKEQRELIIEQKNDLDIKNQELIKSESNLKVANAEKDKFFSIIAHDLKSPLGALKNLLDMMYNDFDNFSEEEIKELLEELSTSSKGVLSLLENLLQWSRSQTGRIEYKPEQLSLELLFNQINNIFITFLKNKKIKLSLNANNLNVYADIQMLMTIIRNLTSNAIKFTPENGEINISAIKRDNYALISVKDTGIGMSDEAKNKLFRIDVHHTTLGTNNEKGTGLGLILCKEFVEMNKGQISVESEIGKGTTFKFTIPLSEND